MAGAGRNIVAMVLVWWAASSPLLADPSFAGIDRSLDQPGRSLISTPVPLQQKPPECSSVPLENYVAGQSPVPHFWSTLTDVLRDRGFSAAQINKLQEVFGHLDASGLQGLSQDQLLPWMTGRTVAQKQQKIALFQAAVQEVHACLNALTLAKTDADPRVQKKLKYPPRPTRDRAAIDTRRELP